MLKIVHCFKAILIICKSATIFRNISIGIEKLAIESSSHSVFTPNGFNTNVGFIIKTKNKN